MTKVKICGLLGQEDIDAVNKYMPDYIGFVFVSKSKRAISLESAKQLKKRLRPGIGAVGVFVNEKIERIVDAVKENIIDTIQLHGNETEEYIKTLREITNIPIIKAVRVTSLQEKAVRLASCQENGVRVTSGQENGVRLASCQENVVTPTSRQKVDSALDSCANILLFDSERGGSGNSFDLSLIPKNIRKPFFVAGGLNINNVKKTLDLSRPFGVDVSSGVESNGRKDAEKIREFIKTVRNYQPFHIKCERCLE